MILVATHPTCLFQSPERAAFAKMLLFDEKENRSTRKKTSRIKEENQQQTDLTGLWRRLRDLNPATLILFSDGFFVPELTRLLLKNKKIHGALTRVSSSSVGGTDGNERFHLR